MIKVTQSICSLSGVNAYIPKESDAHLNPLFVLTDLHAVSRLYSKFLHSVYLQFKVFLQCLAYKILLKKN